MGEIRFTLSSRRHRIGRARAVTAMVDAGEPRVIPTESGMSDRLLFIGRDDRGLLLEVIAVQTENYLLVMHVMPYEYRKGRS